MSDIQTCPTCNGKKEVIGLGCLKKKCDECKGVGWINAKKELPQEEKTPAKAEKSAKKSKTKKSKDKT